jgi:hypothetical protein
MHGQPARRTARHFGVGYDYDARRPQSAEPLPDWLEGPRARAAGLARVEPDDLVEALAQRYPVGSTIGWHRDAPAFGRVGGISVAGACRLRFRPVRDTKRVWEVALERAPPTCSAARRAGVGSTRYRPRRRSGTRSHSALSDDASAARTTWRSGTWTPFLESRRPHGRCGCSRRNAAPRGLRRDCERRRRHGCVPRPRQSATRTPVRRRPFVPRRRARAPGGRRTARAHAGRSGRLVARAPVSPRPARRQ